MAKITLENGMVFEGTVAEIAELAEKFGGEKPLQVGDYAKVINADYGTMGGFVAGEIVKIIESSYGEDDEDFRVCKIDSNFTGYILKSDKYIVRATDAEVEQAERKQAEKAEEARWAAVGRQVGEFKKGDIVRVIKLEGGIRNGHTAGVIGEVLSDSTVKGPREGNPAVIYNGYPLHSNCELITPAEARFDRKDAE